MRSFMKSLKEYIDEGLLDRVKNKEVNHEILIEEFLKANYKINGSYTIKEIKNGFIVDVRGSVTVDNKDITSLTNGLFEFGMVSGYFDCDDCKLLKTLEGAPKKVGGSFDCSHCKSLTSLEGAPKKVDWDFDCSHCKSLTSLEGSPKEIGGSFYCSFCDSLTSLEGSPEKIRWHFWGGSCKSLTSLKGAPKEIGGEFSCQDCGIQFTEDDVRKHTNVTKKIYV